MRGHKSGLLSTSDYNNMCQCETLDDIKLHLVGRFYLQLDELRSWPSRFAPGQVYQKPL